MYIKEKEILKLSKKILKLDDYFQERSAVSFKYGTKLKSKGMWYEDITKVKKQ